MLNFYIIIEDNLVGKYYDIISNIFNKGDIVSMTGIYKITNLINQHSYIGKSNNIHRRWEQTSPHLAALWLNPFFAANLGMLQFWLAANWADEPVSVTSSLPGGLQALQPCLLPPTCLPDSSSGGRCRQKGFLQQRLDWVGQVGHGAGQSEAPEEELGARSRVHPWGPAGRRASRSSAETAAAP